MGPGVSLNGRGITLPRLLLVALLLLALYFLRDDWLPKRAPPQQPQRPPGPPIQHTESEAAIHEGDALEYDGPLPHDATPKPSWVSCSEAPGADKIMVLLKTGATELYQKLPMHFLTTFACAKHFMIFSDLAQTFANHTVHDAIAPVGRRFREGHEDFRLYWKLQQYQLEGQDVSKLGGDGGWNLDKWKFFPMMHAAFAAAADDIEWFVIIEADTSISWSNLLQWLKRMDPREPFYLGAQNVIGSTTFAHGGSGIIVSRRAADMLEERRRGEGEAAYDKRWEEAISTACCGDEVIARALLEADVPLTPSWPIIQGETVSSLDWTENHWCTPAVSWHHVSPLELDALWRFDNEWVAEHGWATPYLYRDVFARFIQRHVAVNRSDWNNLSRDRRLAAADLANPADGDEDYTALAPFERDAVLSQHACARACLLQPDDACVQWMFSPGRCHLGRVIRFGKSDEGGGGGGGDNSASHWVSGWIQERLQKYRDSFEGCEVGWRRD